MKILVAEDDEISSLLLESILVGEGHTVVVTKDGNEAFEEFQKGGYPMVITDWMMPQMDGLELTKKIREHCETIGESPYIIMVTAKNRDKDMVYALESGVDDFLAKPYDRGVLKERIRARAWRDSMLQAPAFNEYNPFASLKEDHQILRSMTDILETIERELDNGVPDEVIRWWDMTALKLTTNVHLEKEERYMSIFLDRVLETQGEWLMDLSASSFETISEEHERIIYLLNEVHLAIQAYLSIDNDIILLIEESKQSFLDVFSEDDFAGTLMDVNVKYLEHRNKKEETISMLRNSIEMYLNLFRAHEEVEEKYFFPFAEKYLTEEDVMLLKQQFKEIEEEAGIDEIKLHHKEISKLSEVISAGGNFP